MAIYLGQKLLGDFIFIIVIIIISVVIIIIIIIVVVVIIIIINSVKLDICLTEWFFIKWTLDLLETRLSSWRA